MVFSFLLSIPAIAASGLLELREAIHKLPDGSYGALIVATIVLVSFNISDSVGHCIVRMFVRAEDH